MLDLLTGELGPPLLLPVLGMGMILAGVGNRNHPGVGTAARITLETVGGVLIVAVLWTLLLPVDLADRVGAYRIFGVGAVVFPGVGWVAFGLSIAKSISGGSAPVRA